MPVCAFGTDRFTIDGQSFAIEAHERHLPSRRCCRLSAKRGVGGVVRGNDVRKRQIPVSGESGNIDPLAGPELFGTSHAVGKPAEHSSFEDYADHVGAVRAYRKALMKANLRRSDGLHSLRLAQTQ